MSIRLASCVGMASWLALGILVLSANAEPDELPAPRPLAVHQAGVPAINGFQALPPLVPIKPPRTAKEVAAFVDNLSSNDATVEVVVGQGRILSLKKDLAAAGKQRPVIAVGDPVVVDFVVVGPRQLRLVGKRIGRTDLSVITADNEVYNFAVQVVADLDVLRAQLKAVFPGASLNLAQVRDHVVVEGQARDTTQVGQILDTIRQYLISIQAGELSSTGQAAGAPPPPQQQQQVPLVQAVQVRPEEGLVITNPGTAVPDPRIINLIRVPGPQQVLLKVRVAELNRTCLREVGADLLGVDQTTGSIFGTQIGGGAVSGTGTFTGDGLAGLATAATNATTTVFGIFEGANFEVLLRALRRNSILKILAEPNLVTMHGHPASFLAGGEFPIPVPQVSGGGFASTITIQFREFGVRLGFVPYILDGDRIRLSVDPEVSTIDFALGTVLVPGGTPVPGLNIRKSHATVELREGQTLAIAGLIQVQLDSRSSRIPIMGDLPIIGTFFRSNSDQRQEKELVVLVTPYLVEPMNPGEVPPTPGDEVGTPTDLEYYLLGRIESRKGVDFRSTLSWDDPLHLRHFLHLERKYLHGPCGHSE